MSEQVQATATVETPVEQQAVDTPAANRQQTNVISDPRQIATVVMARMNLINAKKDELTIDRSHPAIGAGLRGADAGHRATRHPCEGLGSDSRRQGHERTSRRARPAQRLRSRRTER